jgi:prevent-host-death family protein
MAKKRSERTVTASEAAKNFGALVDRVREEAAEYIVERSGKPVARIGPVTMERCTLRELFAWLNAREPLDAAYLDEVEKAVAAFNEPSVPGTPWER